MKAKIAKKHIIKKLSNVKENLIKDHLVEIDGSGRWEIEWLISVLSLLIDGKIEIVE